MVCNMAQSEAGRASDTIPTIGPTMLVRQTAGIRRKIQRIFMSTNLGGISAAKIPTNVQIQI